MLKKLKLKNYTTFINETVIDFKATNSKILEETNVGTNKILKGTLFVGENASGKTQVLLSIRLLLDLLFSKETLNIVRFKSLYTDVKDYTIEYTFDINDEEIVYEIIIGIEGIISEKLRVEDKVLLERIGSNASLNFNENKTIKNIDDNLLYLRSVYFDTKFHGHETLIKWFNFLENSIYINCYDTEVRDYGQKNRFLQNFLNDNTIKEINDFLKLINYNSQIKLEKDGVYKSKYFTITSKDNNKMISFLKKGTKTYIPDLLESTGNITLTQIIPSLLYIKKNDGMIILDEFSSGLHNELEESLIKYFFLHSNNSQLFFTSHSTNILDNTIIRPDQVYSTSFKANVGTILKRFSDEMPRESQNIEKMYLGGVFDGMPKYNKVFKTE